MKRRFVNAIVGCVLYSGFLVASPQAAIWVAWSTGAFAQSNKLWIWSVQGNDGALSITVLEPARYRGEDEVQIYGYGDTIRLARRSPEANSEIDGDAKSAEWTPDALRELALRSGFQENEVSVAAVNELFGAIELIRRDGREAMYYESTIFDDQGDPNALRMKHWEAQGPGYRFVPDMQRASILFVLWIIGQIAAIYGAIRLLRFAGRKLSARSDARTPCPGS